MSGVRDPIHFLLVDDLQENLLALEALLQREGLACLKARSGDEALELLLTHDVALALLDVQMPGMDGYQLAEFMRGAEVSRHVPIIFLTAGVADRQRRFRGYEAGAVDFLQKPYREQALLDSIHAALALDAAERRAHAGADAFARRLATLTPREREVFDQLLAGRTSKEIAATLDISPRTAEVHRRSLLHKFGVGSAKELIPLSASAGVLRT